MKFSRTAIDAVACELPPDIWPSERIETELAPLYERLKLPAGRLELMTGIRERRFWAEPILPSEAGALAGRKALEKSAVEPEAIELLIHAGVCRDRLEPATAANAHRLLGLSPKAQIMDVSNACLGFANAMTLAAGMIESGQIRRALIVSGENGRPLVERTIRELLDGNHDRKSIKPYFANLTIGAGAAAAVMCEASLAGKGALRLLGGASLSDSDSCQLCEGDSAEGGSLQMQTQAEALLDAGIELAGKTWEAFRQATGWDERTPERVVCHQVGRQHQIRLFEALRLDPQKDFTTFERLGNIGSVSLPATLALALEEKAVKPGMPVALLGIGSGLSCMMLALHA